MSSFNFNGRPGYVAAVGSSSTVTIGALGPGAVGAITVVRETVVRSGHRKLLGIVTGINNRTLADKIEDDTADLLDWGRIHGVPAYQWPPDVWVEECSHDHDLTVHYKGTQIEFTAADYRNRDGSLFSRDLAADVAARIARFVAADPYPYSEVTPNDRTRLY